MSVSGDILTIDLTTRHITTTPLTDADTRRYLGGRGLNTWQLGELVGPDVDPLGPENVLMLSCGLLTGSVVPASARLQLAARSPQTGLIGASNVGGHFGASLRHAGYQMIRVIGRAASPVTIHISPDRIDIRDAAHLWGLDIPAAAEALQAANDGPPERLLLIGPGGENLVRYASALTDDNHAAGRTGMGAVMGSKNLKAIGITAPRPERDSATDLRDLARDYARSIRASERYELYSVYSNAAYLRWTHDLGLLGTYNFRETQFEHVDKINGTELMRYVRRHKACHRCPVHCKAEVRIDHGRFESMIGERPDIEPLMALGPRIGVADPEAILFMYNLTNKLGIDVISTAGALAFAMELYDNGIVTKADTGGLSLEWGAVESAIMLIRQIAARKGFGRVLAEGVRDAAQQIGSGAERYAYHSKGLELPGYDPRGAQGTALGYAISPRGADYASVYASQEFSWSPEQGKTILGSEQSVDYRLPVGKGALVRYASIVSAILDALGVCKVPILAVVGDFSLEKEAAFVSAFTGWDIAPDDLFRIGAQIVTAERRLNLRYGMTAADDNLPTKFLEEPVPFGPAQGKTVSLETMRREFYWAMGWDEHGNPPDDWQPAPGCLA